MALVIDLSGEGVLVPEGRYKVEVQSVHARRAGHGGLYLNWALDIEEGPHAGTRLWMVSSLRPDLLRRLRSTFIAVGVDVENGNVEIEVDSEDEIDSQDGSLVMAPDLVGRHAVAVVVHDEYMGEVRPKVRTLLRASGHLSASDSHALSRCWAIPYVPLDRAARGERASVRVAAGLA